MPARSTIAARLRVSSLCAATLAACSTAPPPRATRPPRVEAQAPVCPRLPRAARTWTGFAVDVPSESMYLALDAVVPIQNALGALFCGAERAPCRPLALVSIELSDASASFARVELDQGATALGALPGVLQLRALNGAWLAEPESLEAFLAACRAAAER